MSSAQLGGVLLVLAALLPSAACGGLDESEPGEGIAGSSAARSAVSGAPIHDGTIIRPRATQFVTRGGQTVKSPWFAHREAAADADAGVTVCVSPWSPFWQQTTSSGMWWAEFQVAGGGSVARSLLFEVVGGEASALTVTNGRWAGAVNGVAAGTSVIMHATDATGATAQTLPFRYLVDSAPVTDQCMGTSSSTVCRPLRRGMVTFTMDDSYQAQALLVRPALVVYGFKATFYQITGHLEAYGLLPSAQALAADGNEIGSHSRTHPNLTTLTPQELTDELLLSRQYLLTNVGPPVESFASPMGAYNDAVVAAIKLYYASNRGVYPGMNYMGSDIYRLSADVVTNASTVSSVCAQLAEAATYRGWRILVFHDFTSAATTSSSLTYPLADFDGILACAQSTPGLDVVTTGQGVSLLACATPG